MSNKTKIIIHLIFQDQTIIELDTFNDVIEYLNSYIDITQRHGYSPICLDDEFILNTVICQGLSTDEIAEINRQMEIVAKLNVSLPHYSIN
jgi:hypothetical protein